MLGGAEVWLMGLVLLTSVAFPPSRGSSSALQPDQRHQRLEYSYPDNIPTTHLQVIAILPDLSRRSLSLSRRLGRTLNSVTALDLVSQLDFPEQNVTWTVRNFVVSTPTTTTTTNSVRHSQQEEENRTPPQADHRQAQQEAEDEEDDEDEDEEYSEYVGDEGEELSPSWTGRRGTEEGRMRKGRGGWAVTPATMTALCDYLSERKGVALVSLLGEAHSDRLLSLISSAAHIPLITSTPSQEGEELWVNVWSWVEEYARATGQLMVHCHWTSFTLLFDDSPHILATQSLWTDTLAHFSSPNVSSTTGHDTSSTPGQSLTEEEVVEEEDEGSRPPILSPTVLTIQTRYPNSAFRALSHLTKATQGVILLILSHRSAKQVFHAAKQLGMLNGEWVFILLAPHADFERIPEWLPAGVLALRPPRQGGMGKARVESAGTLLATSVSNLKDSSIVPLQSSSPPSVAGEGRRRGGGTSPGTQGGVFSGFTNRDFGAAVAEDDRRGRDEESEGRGGWIGGAESPPALRPSQARTLLNHLDNQPNLSCWHSGGNASLLRKQISLTLTREMRLGLRDFLSSWRSAAWAARPPSTSAVFELVNLVPETEGGGLLRWETVGTLRPHVPEVKLRTIRWPGGGIFGPGEGASKSYRVVTIVAPPFVMESQAEDNKTCVRGLPCLKVPTSNKDELAMAFAEFEGGGWTGQLACCDGLAMDLLASVARELNFQIDLFLVPDGYFGSRSGDGGWNGLMGALVSGAAQMSFAPFSVTSVRETGVDFSTPFFFSGVGLLGISKERDVPLLAFLAPFSPLLWAAIFITLNLTALVVAIYEWFSPFGLNPWGRQRTKNFSISSALWVVWGRLFSHLVAFKAPKSWPNKFLINVWGGFSVIFVASYTANIAALFAGMFFERHVDVNDRSLLSQRVTAIKHSATDFYIKRENGHLWEHIQQFPTHSFEDGVQMLKNGTLDLLIGDGPLLDYYRGTDSTCSLIDVSDHDKIGDDTYAVGMSRGFPLKESVSGVISKYIGNGYLDYLQGKWYGQMPCFSKSQQLGARALGVDAVVGMFIMLGLAMILGILISFMELGIFKHLLPFWRAQPKGTLWRSPNVMFFSQKLYRFINCVELVSPHHAAKELAKTLRQGQITSLFQKSVKRKEHEQRRRRKSKAQFYEMIQEIKRVQMAEKKEGGRSTGREEDKSQATIYSIQGEGGDPRGPRLMYKTAEVGGEEILVVSDYPPPTPTTTSGMDYYPRRPGVLEQVGGGGGQGRRIQFGVGGGGISSPAPPHGILRRGGQRGTAALLPPDDSDPEEENSDEEVGADDSSTDDLYSPLDKADLKEVSKGQVIRMWRASEMDLRRQLSQALKAKEELVSQLSRATTPATPAPQTPAMIMEFDQVKI